MESEEVMMAGRPVQLEDGSTSIRKVPHSQVIFKLVKDGLPYWRTFGTLGVGSTMHIAQDAPADMEQPGPDDGGQLSHLLGPVTVGPGLLGGFGQL